MKKLVVDPDIADASVISSEFYTAEEHFDASRELIFARTWQYGGLRSGDYNVRPYDLLGGFLDEPLLFVEEDGTRCFSNVCTHRGNTLISERCNARGLACGYHGRRFDLAGKFVSMPEFEGVRRFPSPEDDLTELRAESWSCLDFVSLSPVAPFSDFFSAIRSDFSDLEQNENVEVTESEYLVNAHWALYCENYLEGFHIPFVHGSLNREIDFDSYITETFRYSSLQTATETGREKQLADHRKGPFSGGAAAYYYFVFPNMMFNFYRWGCSVNIVEPKTRESSVVRYVTIVTEPSEKDSGAGSDLETVELEDQKIVESVQKGIRSRFYGRGRYSAKREAGIHHFHRLIAEFMNDGGTT